MVSCKQCGTHNSLDSTFCKKCGAAVSEADLAEAREKLEALVAEGNHAYSEGRTDEALAITESVLLSDPSSTTALWLKAICHERRGEIAMALECAERVVELNPDSELDKIRRNQLRSKLSAGTEVRERPDQRVALIGSIAAFVLVVCVGYLAANYAKSRQEPDILASNDQPSQTNPLDQRMQTPPSGTDPAPGNTNPNNATANQNGGAQSSQPQSGDEPPLGTNQDSGSGARQPITRPNGTGDSVLPQPEGSRIGPVVVEELPSTGPNKPANPGTSGGSSQQPDKTRLDDPQSTFGSGSGQGASTPPAENPGTIEISVHNGGGTRPDTRPANNSNGTEAASRTAYQAYQIGNFQQAATLFEQALRNGGDPVRLNQRLGQSYERLGRTSDAIDAYRRAVQAGQAAIAQGKPDPNGIRSVVESSQQALRKLGG